MSTQWPDEVTIPDKIGTGFMRYGGRPCCAWGHARHECHGEAPAEWVDAFCACAAEVSGEESESIVVYNDCVLTPEERVLVYAAAWVYCGYDLDWPEAVELAKRAKENGL